MNKGLLDRLVLCVVCWCVPLWIGVQAARGQEKVVLRRPEIKALSSRLPLLNPRALTDKYSLPDNWREHPLASAVTYAHKQYMYAREHVQDYTCVLAKRERIDGELAGYQLLDVKVRCRQTDAQDAVIKPLSVYVRFMGRGKHQGRRILYVDGRHEGKMLVRKGGKRFSFLTVKISLDSEVARRESRYAVTELGPDNQANRLFQRLIEILRADPAGKNTEVRFDRNAKVGDRLCTQVEIVNPQRDEQLGFHIFRVYLDDELRVPIRSEAYDWPTTEGVEPLLLEEYTFRRLKLNVGLSDEDFEDSVLRR